MLSDRKLTGLKSKMEINNLTPLSDREDGHACWRLGGQAAADRASPACAPAGSPGDHSTAASPLTADLPCLGCVL